MNENNYTSTSNIHNTGIVKHYSPSTEEWNNSIYTYNKNEVTKLIPAIDISVYNLLKSYFNMNPSHKLWIRSNIGFKIDKSRIRLLSVKNLFISKPKINHSNFKVNISIYVYNRKKLYYINKLTKLIKLHKRLNLKKLFIKVKSFFF